MRVLLVDDARAVHGFVKGMLVETEYNFTSAFNGQEAVDAIANDPTFDLILLDWEMPVMNGIDALKAIRALGYAGVIIMVTSKSDITNIAQSLEYGANEYVIKPFTKEILVEKLSLAKEGGVI